MIILSVQDYIKFLTQQVTTYIDSANQSKIKQESLKEINQPSYSNHWLGVLPFAFKTFFKAK